MKLKVSAIAVGLIILFIIGSGMIDIVFQIKLHQALGYLLPYIKELEFKGIMYGIGIIFAILSVLAVRTFRKYIDRTVQRLFYVVAAIVGFIFGTLFGQADPTEWLLFFHHTTFGKADPIFHLDYSFYVFSLPIIKSVLARIGGIIVYFVVLKILTIIIIASLPEKDDVNFEIKLEKSVRSTGRLFAFTFLILGINSFLSRYTSLYKSSEGNFLYGPGYTDLHWTLPISIWVNSIAYLAIGVVIFIFTFKRFTSKDFENIRTFKSLFIAVFAKIGIGIITVAIGLMINQFYVHPNQASLEAPYIKHTIDATRWAFDVSHVKVKNYTPSAVMTNNTLSENATLLANVRINDSGQTNDVFDQLQSFKSYYTFNGVDSDRYNGQQVYIGVRELNSEKLPVKTWTNQMLVYTHGYGIAASPVNEFDNQGLPIMIAKDTPQTTNAPIPKITRPQVYFGTMTNEVIAPSKEKEFDYPSGSADVTSQYKGGYALPVKGNQLLLAFEKQSLKFLTSSQFTNKSQLLFDRNIYNRVEDIAPFLTYDKDLYSFIDQKGHIKWMLDAYTSTANIPYSQSFDGVSYQRNSVKVVMDAYTGQVTFYVVDKKDPIIKSLMKVYPNLFTTTIPSDVAAHFRYPKKQFNIQANVLKSYHMTEPSAFYNQEDLWDVAEEIYKQNEPQPRISVYQMIQMPGDKNLSYVISQLYTPNGKSNLNGWLIAGNDLGQYGQLTLYKFPENDLFFGPMQAENQIDSDPAISSQLTLWNQQGSHVVRGNLLLVPISNTALYIEPIYLVADRQGSLPQLQRVIIDFNKKVYMGDTLTDALRNLINQESTGEAGNAAKSPSNGTTTNKDNQLNVKELAQKANKLLDDYNIQISKGQYSKAGSDLEEVRLIIQQLTKK